MADYTAVFTPSRVVSLITSSTVTGGDILTVTGSGTVAKCMAAQSMSFIGVAAQDTQPGQPVGVFCRGFVHESIAEGTVTAGDQIVTSSASGRQVKTLPPLGGAPGQQDVNAARAIIGCALTTAADNAKVRWMEW